MTAPEAPEVIDVTARAAVLIVQETLGQTIEVVDHLADVSREHDDATLKAIERLGFLIGHLADRVRALELDHKLERE